MKYVPMVSFLTGHKILAIKSVVVLSVSLVRYEGMYAVKRSLCPLCRVYRLDSKTLSTL